MIEFNINQEKLNMDFQNEVNHLQEMLNLRNSNQGPPVDLYDLKVSDEGNNEINSLTKEPSDTLLMGDKVISTTPERENDEFIKSSVDDLVPIPKGVEEDISSLLVTPLPDSKEISLKEVERSDPLFSLTQSGGKMRVMETPSFGFHHIPSPHPVAYSPTEVMYCYYHPYLTSGDGFDH
ncbi:hypothetical protein Tco_1162315 [Tanacetum coccineum]